MITCGFFNAIDGDRTYTAEQMNNPYKRLISNGVFAAPNGEPSNDFKVMANGTMIVNVNAGDGIFHGKWTNNDAPYEITIDQADVSYPRIDTIVLRVDYGIRTCSLVTIKGTPSNNPNVPEITRDETVFDYRLANIRINANADSISQGNIADTRASSECGFITHLLYQTDISTTFDQWAEQFNDWFNDVKETLATSTLIRSYSSRYTTSTSETEIPILISQYDKNTDILQVYVNGLIQTPLTYTITSNTQIVFNTAIESGSNVDFVVYKSVDGSDAETVVSQVYQLQQLQQTTNSGGVKKSITSYADVLSSFDTMGLGIHTMYSETGAINAPAVGAFRYYGHITGATTGWLLAFQADGSVYSNYKNGGDWLGWKTLFRKSNNLYYSENGVYPNSNVEIEPSKALNECEHGWELVFTFYQNGALMNNIQTFHIPKKSPNNTDWNNGSVIIPLAFFDESLEFSYKIFNVRNNKLISNASNSVGINRNFVLKSINEY